IQPLVSLYLFMPYFGLSLVFCGLYTRTKNLNVLIFVHGIYDALLVVYGFVASLNVASAIIFIAVSFMMCGIGIVVIMRTYIKEKHSTSPLS
nr:hypothetical protein [Candidatus Sigynarchaeota archaeon]